MRFTITGRGIDLTDELRNGVENKLSRLGKYFAEDAEAHVTLEAAGSYHKVEVTIPTKVGLIRAEDGGYDMYSSFDTVADIIEKQIKKYKTKLIDKKQDAAAFSRTFLEEDDAEPDEDEDEIRIVRSKRFAVKPMDAEEACLQMEMLGHTFFVFLNSDTGQVNVVYKRKGGTYGLIEPEV